MAFEHLQSNPRINWKPVHGKLMPLGVTNGIVDHLDSKPADRDLDLISIRINLISIRINRFQSFLIIF